MLNEEFISGKQKLKEQDCSTGISVKEKSIFVRSRSSYLRNKRYLTSICVRNNNCFKLKRIWSWHLIKRGRHMNRKMSMQENKLSIKQTMIELSMFRKWKERDPIWRISLMVSNSRMLKLWKIKKISRRKYCLPLISSRQSNNNATRQSNNLWSYLRLLKRVKRKLTP